MYKTIRLDRTGGTEVLETVEIAQERPGSGEVWIAHDAIGVNYLDVMQRKGLSPLTLPGSLGLEAAGRVIEVGPDVENVSEGDRVGYILGPPGAYSDARLYPAARLVAVPDEVSSDAVAATLFKGITAQYLLTTTYKVGPGTTILLYGAAGGVGQIMAAWAKHLGASVIGVVSKSADIDVALSAGCEHGLEWNDDLPRRVANLTGGSLVEVVYDGVGRLTFDASLACLKSRGLMVSIGSSTGAPPAVEMATLNARGSLYVTRPSLAAHATDPKEYLARANDVLNMISSGVIKPAIASSYNLANVREAHEALEKGGVKGSIILKP
jgi:NADPH2:quinone reductase